VAAPDPDDDLVLETAANGHAEGVITFNRRHFEPAAPRFAIEIVAPAEAVRRLESRA
jgi:predicted nucleic acid-binding protein